MQLLHRAFAALAGVAVCLGLAGWRLKPPPATSRVDWTADGELASVARAAWVPVAPNHSARGMMTTEPALESAPLHVSMEGALAEPDSWLRGEAIVIALREWGSVNVHAAGAWAASQSEIDRTRAVAAVLNAAVAAGRAGEAEQLVVRLTQPDAAAAHDYGAALIHALGAANHHARAAALAAQCSGETATSWLTLAYSAWARRDPEAAVIAGADLADVARQRVAFHAAISVWARVDPTRLAECALRFPAGPERDFAIVSALRTWSAREPIATAAWMHAHRDLLARINGFQLVLED